MLRPFHFSVTVTFAISICFFNADLWGQTSISTIDATLKKNDIPNSALSLVMLPIDQNLTAINLQGDLAVAPASTMKLVTTYVGLDTLGPNFRWKTQILTDGAVKKESLIGNLYVRGGGDPNLTYDKLGLMLRSLRQQGIRDIIGDIVLDRSYFQPNRPELNQPAFDENPDAYYNVIPDALLIHSNITALSLESTEDTVNVKLMVPMDRVVIHNQMTLNKRPCAEWKNTWNTPQITVNDQGQIDMTISGSFPQLCHANDYLNLFERNAYISSMWRALWQELGGTWTGKIRDGQTPTNASLLHERQSESLAEIIRIVNKASDNAMARIVFLTLGAESTIAKNFADTSQASNAVIREWFASHGINDTGMLIENGSGLSRLDRISAKQLASLLLLAAKSQWQPEFAASLPIVGVDGTMRKRLKASVLEGKARIKTGYLKNVVAIAGYVRDVEQHDWVVVGIINSDKLVATKARTALDELMSLLAAAKPQ